MLRQETRNKSILALLVCASIALPIVALPIGIREDVTSALRVRAAYDDVFPEEEVEPELSPEEIEEQFSDEDYQYFLNGGTISSTYEGDFQPLYTDTEYQDVAAFTVFQATDEAGLPIELLDPLYFAPDETTYYIAAPDSILKEKPDMSSITLQTLDYADEVTRIAIGDTWSMIRTEDGAEGYVLTASLSYEMVWVAVDRTVWVDTGSLTIRAEASVDSENLGTLYRNDRLHVIGLSDKWYHVVTPNGTEGYVYRSYTTQTAPPTPTPRPSRTGNGGRGGGSSSGGGGGGGGGWVSYGTNGYTIASIAESMVGTPYVWGASSSSAVDCSGLVCYAYAQLGVGLPHYSGSLTSVGVAVPRDQVMPGDIICWDSGGYCGHVGIYVGNGMAVDARGRAWGTVYGSIDRSSILTIRRIFT
ncbi:MAG: C40 family peptidase [Saccharofermentans sp.]|nr:C40 family peptidase [Saccharofermentans sp.]